MIERRAFGEKLLGGALATRVAGFGSAGAAASQARRVAQKNTLMHVGGDYHSVAGGRGAGMTAKENLEYNLRHGVKHLTVRVSRRTRDGGWDLDELKRMRDDCDKYGVILEAIRMDSDYITQGTEPERARVLDHIAGNIEKAAQAGVKIITYHWTVIPIRRNTRRAGRGGAAYNAFQLEDNWKELPVGESGRVSSDEYWRRISLFLERLVPVAKQYDVRLACHPYDPPGLPLGYQGADNWDSPSIFDAIKRYESIVDSPYNGFQLCLGTTGEGLKNPKTEILPIVRYLGERGKIYQIHMRNIRGGLQNFAEVYPDEGDMDFHAVMRILRDVQFPGGICPDHMPRHANDADGLQAFAFGYGYIKALIQAVNSEVCGAGRSPSVAAGRVSGTTGLRGGGARGAGGPIRLAPRP
ncbi:MAG: mannonate dehydratase [Acidobacteria bacterium]|nr:mannonate dehydratase [Acidobacteriota bacterium]